MNCEGISATIWIFVGFAQFSWGVCFGALGFPIIKDFWGLWKNRKRGKNDRLLRT